MLVRPFLSIIIPAYQAENYIRDALLSLKRQEYPKEKLEIIVVISGEDFTLNICKDLQKTMPNLEIHYYSNRLSAGKARNIGVSFAKGDIFLFIDADCIAHPNWISMIIENFNEFPEIVGVLGVYTGGKSLIEKVLGGELISNKKKINEFPSFIEGNCAFKKIVFNNECKFSNVTYGEGASLIKCVKHCDFKVLLDPNIKIMHLGKTGLLKYAKMGEKFFLWHLQRNSDKKIVILKGFFKSFFAILSLFLLILGLLLSYFDTFTFYEIPIFFFLISPFLLVNIVYTKYIRKDYLLSKSNKIKYFPFLILMRWVHQVGYFMASIKMLPYLLKS